MRKKASLRSVKKPVESPALAFLASALEATPDASPDVAERHDAYLAEFELAAWRRFDRDIAS